MYYLEIFTKLGYETKIISGECCGIPLLTSGDYKGFLKHRESLLHRFLNEDAKYIVSGCPTCLTTIKNIWPSFPGFSEELNTEFEILDFHEFFFRNFDEKKFKKTEKSAEKIRWHQPCHLNTLGVKKEPGLIIEKLSGSKPDNDKGLNTCCGFGGTFSMDHPFLSREIGEKRKNDLGLKDNDVIVTGCPACMVQFTRLTLNKNVDVLHTIDFVADKLQ